MLDSQSVVELGLAAAAVIAFSVDLRARVRSLESARRERRQDLTTINDKLDRIIKRVEHLEEPGP
jgi:hypothetical protein